MASHDLAALEGRIKELQQVMGELSKPAPSGLKASAAGGDDFAELFTVIHRPGWTSVAELMLVTGLVDAMTLHAKTLSAMKQSLMAGARAVGVQAH